MIPKPEEKEKVIKLRKRGFSYSEILKKVPIARSTLSLWLKSVGLAKAQFQRNTQRRIEGGLRGAAARKRNRIATTKEIKDRAKAEITNISQRDLWLMGIALYWAEGSKEKKCGRGAVTKFSNSDPRMILFFLKWLEKVFSIKKSELVYELYIHETANIEKSRIYWSKTLSISKREIKTYFKKNKIKTLRKNTGEDYHGLIRIRVRRSSNLNRRIDGWIDGICKTTTK